MRSVVKPLGLASVALILCAEMQRIIKAVSQPFTSVGEQMAAKDRYAYAVKCDQCGTEGTVHASENDYPFMSSLDFHIENIEGEFIAWNDGKNEKVKCKGCGAIVD